MKKKSTTYRLNKVDYAIFIIFSIAAAVMLFLFYRDLNSFTIKQSEEPVAKIYFKRNTAQRKFIDNDIWEVLTNSSDIYDGDRIRTSKNSEAYTEFNDSGIQIQLREKSMVQIFKNKKERSVDFIGGEIFVATTKPEEKVVIHYGKNEISIGQVSEVKLALPEVPDAVASGEEEAVEKSPVIIEVISGQVEIKEEPLPAPKDKAEKVEPAPKVVSAGETVTIKPVAEAPAKAVEEKVPEPVQKTEVDEVAVEAITEEVEETALHDDFEETEEVEEEIAEVEKPKVEAMPAPAPVTTPVPAPAPAAQEKTEEKTPPVNAYINPEDLYEPVEYKVEKTATRKSVSLKYNPWFDEQTKENKYNYYYDIPASNVFGASRKVPKNSVIMLELSGVPDNDVREIMIQITTGGQDWGIAHPWLATYPDYGRGLKKDQYFNIKRYFTITSDIVNTNNSTIGICYDPDKLDESLTIKDLEIKATVIPDEGDEITREISWKFAKDLNYDSIELRKDQWGKGSREFNYRIDLNGDAVFGRNINIPKGKKLQITVSGVTDKTIQNFHIELYDNSKDNWVHVLQFKNDNDWDKLNFSQNPTSRGRKFKYTKVYNINQNLTDSNASRFSLVVNNEGLKEAPVFTDLEINIAITGE